jgi:hypothetical protein
VHRVQGTDFAAEQYDVLRCDRSRSADS